jgi:hypothetical protein
MAFPGGEIQVLNVDHLGIIAGIVDEIGLVEEVNALLEVLSQKVKEMVR